jgi:hypothetical protein
MANESVISKSFINPFNHLIQCQFFKITHKDHLWIEPIDFRKGLAFDGLHAYADICYTFMG